MPRGLGICAQRLQAGDGETDKMRMSPGAAFGWLKNGRATKKHDEAREGRKHSHLM